MNVSSDVQNTALIIAGAFALVNLLAVGLFFLFGHLTDGPLRERIRSVIYYLDEWADGMDNASKRAGAISAVSQLLAWRKILIPTALIGILIDLEVAAIRRMQAACAAETDLHNEEGASK